MRRTRLMSSFRKPVCAIRAIWSVQKELVAGGELILSAEIGNDPGVNEFLE
jgi:hypothetical protein